MSANRGDPAPVAGERGSRGHIRGSAPVGAVLAAFSLLAMGGAACSSLTQGTAPVPSTGAYVALGDSYTSGPFIPNQVGSPSLCLRSDHSYPYLVAQAEHAPSFVDVSCQGATTVDMTSSQDISVIGMSLQHNPPQFDALSASTRLVTIGIGGNDIGFSTIVVTCAEKAVSNPTGAPCKDYYTSGGTDQLANAIADAEPKVAATLQGIHKLAPNAKVLVVGYPDILPVTGPGCYPLVPIASGDVSYLNQTENELNSMLAATAQANGATFIDTYNSSIGHDACQSVDNQNWVVGIAPNQPAAPVHPDAAGMANDAAQVEAALASAGFKF
jgi:lysophospholipase L1-like esterase